jgi:hypothetical protein
MQMHLITDMGCYIYSPNSSAWDTSPKREFNQWRRSAFLGNDEWEQVDDGVDEEP